MTGDTYTIQLPNPYTVINLIQQLPLEKRPCKFYRHGMEESLPKNTLYIC